MEETARACIKNEVCFEINCGHKHPELSDIMIVNKLGVTFIVNSDAHFTDTVARLDYGDRIVGQLDIEPERIANRWQGGEYNENQREQRSTFAHYYRDVRRGQNPGH